MNKFNFFDESIFTFVNILIEITWTLIWTMKIQEFQKNRKTVQYSIHLDQWQVFRKKCGRRILTKFHTYPTNDLGGLKMTIFIGRKISQWQFRHKNSCFWPKVTISNTKKSSSQMFHLKWMFYSWYKWTKSLRTVWSVTKHVQKSFLNTW